MLNLIDDYKVRLHSALALNPFPSLPKQLSTPNDFNLGEWYHALEQHYGPYTLCQLDLGHGLNPISDAISYCKWSPNRVINNPGSDSTSIVLASLGTKPLALIRKPLPITLLKELDLLNIKLHTKPFAFGTQIVQLISTNKDYLSFSYEELAKHYSTPYHDLSLGLLLGYTTEGIVDYVRSQHSKNKVIGPYLMKKQHTNPSCSMVLQILAN
jgi:hypothetical protein